MYGMKISKWNEVDGFDENLEMGKVTQATVSNMSWATSSIDYDKMSEKEINHHSRFLVPALRWQNVSNNEIILEFDIDSYSKFVYVSKREEGIAVSFE